MRFFFFKDIYKYWWHLLAENIFQSTAWKKSGLQKQVAFSADGTEKTSPETHLGFFFLTLPLSIIRKWVIPDQWSWRHLSLPQVV